MSALDEYTEAVAVAQRELYVAEELLIEQQRKLKMADEEVSAAHRRFDEARKALSDAAIAKHEAIHGKPVSIDDRFEFERRWDARVKENAARNARYEADKAERIREETRKQLAVAKTIGNIAG